MSTIDMVSDTGGKAGSSSTLVVEQQLKQYMKH